MDSPIFLKQVPLFRALSLENLNLLAQSLRHQTFKKGEVLFNKGDDGTALYVIKKGSVKITRSSPEGDEVILCILSEGDFFGEMALLDQLPRSADAVAFDQCEVLVLNRSDFLRFLWNNEHAIHTVLSSISMRLRKSSDLLEDTCFLNISERFAKKLVDLCETYGRQEDDAVRIDLHLVQKDLADMIGATRESVNKEMKILREKGLVTTTGSTIRVLNLERLRRRIEPSPFD